MQNQLIVFFLLHGAMKILMSTNAYGMLVWTWTNISRHEKWWIEWQMSWWEMIRLRFVLEEPTSIRFSPSDRVILEIKSTNSLKFLQGAYFSIDFRFWIAKLLDSPPEGIPLYTKYSIIRYFHEFLHSDRNFREANIRSGSNSNRKRSSQ